MVRFKGKVGGNFLIPASERSVSCTKRSGDTWVCNYDNGNTTRISDKDLVKCKAKGTGDAGLKCVMSNDQTVFA